MTSTVTAKMRPPSVWLLGPWQDLLLCCGGLAWVFVVADQGVLRPHLPTFLGQVTIVMSVLSLLAGSSHTAATLLRIYDSPESRRHFVRYTVWLPLGLAVLAAAELARPAILPTVLKITLFWNLHHYTAQSYGFVLLYCMRRRYAVSAFEKRALYVFMTATTATIVLMMLTYREYNLETFLGQSMPFWGPLPTWICNASWTVLGTSGAALLALVGRKWWRGDGVPPLPAVALLATNAVLMVAPADLWNILWAYMPALFHGTQYVVITLLYFAGGQEGETVGQRLAASGAVSRYVLMVAVGAFFYSAVPQTFQQAGIDFQLAFAAIYSVVSLHHYATDAAIWKLRDDRLRAALMA